jgi:hypothetical protein
MITLNEAGQMLFERLQNDTTEEELADLLVSAYGIEKEQALSDVRAFLAPLAKAGVLLA